MNAQERLDPAGIWSCVQYGDDFAGDNRFVFVLFADGGAYRADQRGAGLTAWREYGQWEASSRKLSLNNPQSGREFSADLDRSTLGGRWEQAPRSGGWWCARRSGTIEGTGLDLSRSNSEFFAAPLVSDRMASPSYPLEAIRRAKEGRAVVCFIVDSRGFVRDPEIIELSDAIFSGPSLRALIQSTYRPWSQPFDRPGCRGFDYGLTTAR